MMTTTTDQSIVPVPRGRLETLQRRLDQTAAIAELLATIGSADCHQSACRALADHLKSEFTAKDVFVGVCKEGTLECDLVAISATESFQKSSPLVSDVETVMLECIARRDLICWSKQRKKENTSHSSGQSPATLETHLSTGATMSHEQFSQQHGCETIVSGPLRDQDGQIVGAWMVSDTRFDIDSRQGALDRVAEFLRAAEPLVASSLNLLRRSEPGVIQRTTARLKEKLWGKRRRMVCTLAGLVIAVLCIPVQYQPRCKCVVEPVNRRFVAAPFDGPLEMAFVKAGDEISEGDLLAKMDAREIRWELAGVQAELHRASKERAGHVAAHDSGKAEVSRYEMDRLKVRAELLENRSRNLEIRSPVSGIVVSGDLDEAIGMPLETGQSLFEIAPLDQMVVEVAVPEDTFQYARPGMDVRIRLDAYLSRQMNATLRRIHPRSEIRDGENVFVAEVVVSNKDQTLRPGMQGRASIQSDRKCIGWIFFRRPINAIAAWFGV